MDGSQTASSYYYDGLLGNGQGYKADSHYKETDNITITLITDNRSLEIFFPNGQTYTLPDLIPLASRMSKFSPLRKIFY